MGRIRARSFHGQVPTGGAVLNTGLTDWDRRNLAILGPDHHNVFRTAEPGELFSPAGLALCDMCGTPVDSRRSRCHPCDKRLSGGQYGSLIPPRPAFLTYAIRGSQSATDAYSYKRAGGDAALQRMGVLLGFFISKHSGCFRLNTGHPITHVASVPSGTGRPDHPLEVNLLPMFPSVLARVQVVRTVPDRDEGTRQEVVDPGIVSVGSDVSGRHVLLVDDTWTTGRSVMSVAVALRQAGAAQVSVLCLTRWLSPKYSTTAQWLSSVRLPSYDPTFCPVTRSGSCPSHI